MIEIIYMMFRSKTQGEEEEEEGRAASTYSIVKPKECLQVNANSAVCVSD
jgi:hypothetical protein